MERAKLWLLPAAEILTVGLPFCVFKLLTGALALEATAIRPLGYVLVALGAVDAVVNLVNLVTVLIVRRRVMGACVFDIVIRAGRSSRGHDLGLALDVFVSFGLVAIVVGVGLVAELPVESRSAWNVAVVLNVLGAGIGRLVAAIRSERLA
jgi:hypothetical protein